MFLHPLPFLILTGEERKLQMQMELPEPVLFDFVKEIYSIILKELEPLEFRFGALERCAPLSCENRFIYYTPNTTGILSKEHVIVYMEKERLILHFGFISPFYNCMEEKSLENVFSETNKEIKNLCDIANYDVNRLRKHIKKALNKEISIEDRLHSFIGYMS